MIRPVSRPRRGPQMSATPDSTFTDPEQRIADLERQLAEALEQKAALAEVLQVINASPGDLAPVFEAILDKAMQLCGASVGSLSRFDGELLHQELLRGMSSAVTEFFSRPYRPPEGGWSQRALTGARFVYVPDITADEGRQTRYRYRYVRFRWASEPSSGASAQSRRRNRYYRNQRRRTSGIFRQANRPLAELRCPSGHRDVKRAAHHRDARGAGA